MAENGYGPVTGHVGRIPIYGKTQVNPMGNIEPPACIQNAMMTKDKKPFTYTPGGVDLSHIKTPSMARKMARQRSTEEQEQAYMQQQNGNYHQQGGAPPPPPPPQAPVPPPPPALVIEVPNSKSPKPIVTGERPEIVIPENPIGMLRKTNSPYHWEAEKADMQKMGPVPKFVEKVASPNTVQMPPSTFSQQPPQAYNSVNNNVQRPNCYQNQNMGSPVHKPEPYYPSQQPMSPVAISHPTREMLQRQDSQFNKSPAPFGGQSPTSNNNGPFSPTPNNNWKQPERWDSPSNNMISPQSPQFNRTQYLTNNQQSPINNYQTQGPAYNSSPTYHTLPRAEQKPKNNIVSNAQNNYNNNQQYNNNVQATPQSPRPVENNSPSWRNNTVNKPVKEETPQSIYHNSSRPLNQQPTFTPPWKSTQDTNNNNQGDISPPWKQEQNRVQSRPAPNQPGPQQQQYNPPWVAQDSKNTGVQENYTPQWRSGQDNRNAVASPPIKQNHPSEQPRYQSTMSMPVTPKKPENNSNVQREAVYVNQEPVYYCPGPESPKSIPSWVKSQKEKTKTPPPEWCQKPLETRKSAPRDLTTPTRDTNTEPEWVKKSNEMQRNIREVISPPKNQQQSSQPVWSTIPSENRKSIPKNNPPTANGSRIIPVQIANSVGNQQPQLRIPVGFQPIQNQQSPPGQYSQPTQRIMRVLSPHTVRLDDVQPQYELPTLNKSMQNGQDSQGKTRIIPIQIEGGGGNGANKSFAGRY